MGAGGKWQKKIYERVPKFCSHCMLRGHDNESSRHLLQPMEKRKEISAEFRKPFTRKTLTQSQTIGQALKKMIKAKLKASDSHESH